MGAVLAPCSKVDVLLEVVTISLSSRRYRWMSHSLCPRRAELFMWTWNFRIFWANCWLAVGCFRLSDLWLVGCDCPRPVSRLALLVDVLVILAVTTLRSFSVQSTKQALRSSTASACKPPRSRRRQKYPRRWWHSCLLVFFLVRHFIIIHRVNVYNSARARAYGDAAYGAATGRLKTSASAASLTGTQHSMP